MDSIRAAADGLKLPKPTRALIDDPNTTPDALEAHLRDRFSASEAGGPVRAGKDLRTLAQGVGVLDGEGNLAAKPGAEPALEIPPQHQERVAKIDDLSAQVKDPDTLKALDDAKTDLAAPSRGAPQKAEATIRKAQKVADAEKALEKATGKPIETPAPAEQPAPTGPSPAAVEAARKVPITDAPSLRDAMAQVKNSRDALEGMTASATGNAKVDNPINKTFQAGMKEQKALLNKLIADAKNGKLDKDTVVLAPSWDEETSRADGGRFSPEVKDMLATHQRAVDGLIDALHTGLAAKQEGGGLRARPVNSFDPAFEARTQQDFDIASIVHAGGSTKDVLSHLKDHGSTGAVKVLAARLLKHAVNPTIGFSDQGADDKFLNLDRGQAARASYDPFANHVHLYRGTDLEGSVLHEAVHAATMKALEGNGQAAREFKQLYQDTMLRYPGARLDGSVNGLKDAHEFAAEAFSNPRFQDWLRGQSTAPENMSLWQRFKGAVSKLLGFDGGARTLLDQVMESGHRVMDENATAAGPGESAMRARPNTPIGANDAVREFVARRDGLRDQIMAKAAGLKSSVGRMLLPVRDGEDVALGASRLGVKSAPAIVQAGLDADARAYVHAKASTVAKQVYDALPEAERAKIDNVMATTVLGVDPLKEWNSHSDEITKAANAVDLKQRWAEGRRDYMALSPEGKDAYATRVAANDTDQLARVAYTLYNHATKNWPQVTKGFEVNPAETFQFDDAAHANPRVARASFMKTLGDMSASIKTAMTDTGQTKERMAELTNWSRLLDRTLDNVKNGVPSFHISHGQGDYFVSGRLPLDKAGMPARGAIAELSKRMAAGGFGDRALEVGNDHPGFFARVKTPEQATRLAEIMEKAQKEGVLDPEHKIGAGLAEQAGTEGMKSAVMKSVIAAMRANKPDTADMPKDQADLIDAAWGQHVNEVERQLMDVLSDTSQAAILAKKATVQGYVKQLNESANLRAASTARMLGNLSTSNDLAAAISGSRDEMTALKHAPIAEVSIAQREAAQRSLGELLTRRATRPTTPPSSLVGALSKITRGFELASPAYATLLGSQNLTLVLPKLGSEVGYANAFKHMTAEAANSIKALAGMGWGTTGMREASLKAAGISADKAEYLTHLDNMGKFNVMTHELAPREEGDGIVGKLANLSSAYTMSAEMQPRLMMALAAKRAWDGMTTKQRAPYGDVYAFASKMIDESSFQFNPAAASRLQSRGGPLAETAPLLTQFSKFRTLLTTRLFREFEAGFTSATGKSWSDAERAQARSFLYGHLAATTMLAGTLGLPMVGVMASVADKIADWMTGDPTHDFTASYRSLLATMFGQGAGEAIARGAPRAIGADFEHASEATMVPFVSDALMAWSEKRKLEDAEKDWLKRVAGPSIGMAADWAFGLRDIANGDYLRGLQKMAPEGLRGPLEATEMAKYGYRLKNGQPLQIEGHTLTPGAQDIVMQAFGVSPADEAEALEVNRTAAGLNTRRELQAANISQHWQQATMRGDTAGQAYWGNQGGPVFTSQHPGVAPPVAGFGSSLKENMRQTALGLPPGTSIRDIATRGMTGYANPHQ